MKLDAYKCDQCGKEFYTNVSHFDVGVEREADASGNGYITIPLIKDICYPCLHKIVLDYYNGVD